ncbi:hypothetical protein GCM10027589_27200 [Actinocorallia lasiicapitis]
MRRLLLPLLACVLAVSGCSLRTLGAPGGELTLVARFSDTQNLVAGHSVQISDIKVGSITRVRLVGYESEVTMTIEDKYKIPEGTAAEIAITSLLGENYVKLTLPEGRDMTQGPFYASGARIEKTSVAPQFEQVAGNAGRILKAISGDDVGTLLNETATALDGQGDRLHTMVASSSELVALFARQKDDLGSAIDSMAKLGKALAAHKGSFDNDNIAKTTDLINHNKEKLLEAVEKLTRTAKILNAKVFAGRTEKLRLLIKRLDPTLATLGRSRKELTDLITNLVNFQGALPKVVWDGQLMVSAVLKLGLYSTAESGGGGTLPGLSELIGGVR